MRGTYASPKRIQNPISFEELRTKICERLAQQGWLVSKIVEQSRIPWIGEAWQGFDWARQELLGREENLPTLTCVRGEEVVKNGGLKEPTTSLRSVVRVLIVNHASDASGNCSDCSTFGTTQ